MQLKKYDSVRICRLLVPERHYVGTERVGRPPRPGDTGTVVAISGRGADRTWVVETVTPDGETVWTANFHADELEKVPDEIDRPAGPGLSTYLNKLGAFPGF